jgi:hypothetical protein
MCVLGWSRSARSVAQEAPSTFEGGQPEPVRFVLDEHGAEPQLIGDCA